MLLPKKLELKIATTKIQFIILPIPGEPNYSHCGYVTRNWFWGNFLCSYAQPYICEGHGKKKLLIFDDS